MDFSELKNHLNTTKDKFNVFNIYDKSGYSPIHYAAYKNIEKACEILIEFVLSDGSEKTDANLNGGSGETADRSIDRKKKKSQR